MFTGLVAKIYLPITTFFHFRERFAELPENVREAGIVMAQRRIQRRFSGEVGVDMAYLQSQLMWPPNVTAYCVNLIRLRS